MTGKPCLTKPWKSPLGKMAAVVLVTVLAGCAALPPAGPPPGLPLLGYTIQVGAFAVLDNAVRLTESLQRQGQDATFFKDEDGLYKVRFGDFPTAESARQRAAALVQSGTIDGFYIVPPDAYATAARKKRGDLFVRERIVHTAEGFIGLPYRWGGTSPETGFDCSGLTMTTYRLNGFDLPRTAREQFGAGRPIDKRRLKRGDLVFFATTGKNTGFHVGIYTGDGRFIHAPGRGKVIRTSVLSSGYFRRHFVGARTYL